MKKDIGLTSALAAPTQGRSKASYERMLAAAEALMVSRGSTDFTLNEVSEKGKVSIGSIYNRFEGKGALLHAVQLRTLEAVHQKIHERLERAQLDASDLNQLTVRLIDAYAETLREFAPSLRPLMLRSSTDILEAAGKAAYVESSGEIKSAFLRFRDSIRQPDPDRAVDSAFRIMYGAIARYLGLGSPSAMGEGDWNVLKEDLTRMVAAFLQSEPHF